MYTGFYTAVAGGMAQEKRLNILTNNLANATTAGFKADQAVFQVLPPSTVLGPVAVAEADSPVLMPLDPLAYQHPQKLPEVRTYTDFAQGPLRDTGNPLDVALEGQGFFVVESAGPGVKREARDAEPKLHDERGAARAPLRPRVARKT